MKRFVYVVLVLVLVLGLLPVVQMDVYAAQEFTTSESGIDYIKEQEGFVKRVKLDVKQYSIGYGTRCPDSMLEYYSKNDITPAEADALMRKHLVGVEEEINQFIRRYELELTQAQFDALSSFTYNIGTAWLRNDSHVLHSAIVNGATGSDFLLAMTQCCKASGTVITGLVQRRLEEANIYMNGVYSYKAPANYCYVIYNANNGSCPIKVQGYNSNDTVAPAPIAYQEGKRFVGWFTSATGGTQVTVLTKSLKTKTLYAHWEDVAEGETADPEPILDVLLAYNRTVTVDVSVYDAPNSKNAVGKVAAGKTIRVVGQHTDDNGYIWCLLEDGTWVKHSETVPSSYKKLDTPITIKVTAKSVRTRKGPGTNYDTYKFFSAGQVMTISATQMGTGTLWGKFVTGKYSGWISLDYTNFYDVSIPEPTDPPATDPTDPPATDPTDPPATDPTDPPATDPTDPPATDPTDPPATDPTDPPAIEPTDPPVTDPPAAEDKVLYEAVVKVDTLLNVRSGAGTNYPIIDHMGDGTKVEILETKMVSGVQWGRTSKGWISLIYVQIPDEDDQQNQQTPVQPDTPNVITGVVKVDDYLRIRAKAGVGNKIVGYLTNGKKVEILETKTVKGVKWGRISKGWISLEYVVLDKTQSNTGSSSNTGNTGSSENTGNTGNAGNTGSTGNTGSSENSGNTGNTGNSGNAGGQTEVTTTTAKVTARSLTIRKGPGTSYRAVGYLKKGATLTVLEIKTVNGAKWGRTSKGWISLHYTKLTTVTSTVEPDNSQTSGNTGNTGSSENNTNDTTAFQPYTGKVDASSLWIRKGAGTSYGRVGYYKDGAKVTILEEKAVKGVKWGRTNKGWICLTYVKK